MGQIPMPRTVAVMCTHAAARLYVMGHMGRRAGLPISPMRVMGKMGHAHLGSTARGEGKGLGARGKGRAGSNGPNIQPEKIAPIVVVLCYNITHPIFKDWYIDITHLDH